LRERKEDIPALAAHFFAVYRDKNHKELRDISGKAMDLLIRYDWPGNIRELENCLERAVILARGEIIAPADLPLPIQALSRDREIQGLNLPSGISLQEVEKALILKTLDDTGGNRSRAAEILGINRRTLQNKLKEYGIN
jgi:two-component system response regulator HydG